MRLAFIKYGGMASGGTEKWLQIMAAGIADTGKNVDYFYCDSSPYIGSNYLHPGTDPGRLKFLLDSKVNLIEFHVSYKDTTVPSHDWLETDFWSLFDENKYDLVITGKAGPAEYPYYLLNLPVIDFVALNAGPDLSANSAWSINASQWQRADWHSKGGLLEKSSVIPVPFVPSATQRNFREKYQIGPNNLVIGFHQSPRDEIFSPIPLKAFSKITNREVYFILMGGSKKYKQQAERLGLRNIIFIPFSSDEREISAFLNTLDIYTHGRKDGETFGTVFAEAMARGKPCLSHISKNGSNGHIETIGPGGFVLKDTASYNKKLNELLENAILRKKLGEKAKKHADEYYSIESNLKKMINLIENIVDNKKIEESDNQYGYSKLGFLQSGPLEKSDSISFHILNGGILEEFDLQISEFFFKQSSLFLDVGSNIGLYCLRAPVVNPSIQVHAFEPQIDCCNYLVKSIKLNNLEDQFEVHNIALSDSNGIKDLYFSGSGTSLESDFVGENFQKKGLTSSITLDNWIEEHQPGKIDFIKVDIEGAELAFLRGCQNLIENDQPIFFVEIAMEIKSRGFTNKRFDETIDFMKSRKYSAYVSNGKNRIFPYSQINRIDGVRMYLFVPSNSSKIVIIRLWLYLVRNLLNSDINRLYKFGLKVTKIAIQRGVLRFERIKNKLWKNYAPNGN